MDREAAQSLSKPSSGNKDPLHSFHQPRSQVSLTCQAPVQMLGVVLPTPTRIPQEITQSISDLCTILRPTYTSSTTERAPPSLPFILISCSACPASQYGRSPSQSARHSRLSGAQRGKEYASSVERILTPSSMVCTWSRQWECSKPCNLFEK